MEAALATIEGFPATASARRPAPERAAPATPATNTPNWPRDCGVVIPCLNEAAAIEGLVRAVRQQLPTVVVVDDGSSDATGQRAEHGGATVLRHARTAGKGAALRTGLQWLHARGCLWALLMDGDGQHAPADIPLFLERAALGGATLLVGNRMAHAARMPWVRRTVNRWLSARLSQWCGQHLPDSQCGFRLMQMRTWATLELTTSHFEVESEVLYAFLAAGQRVQFVPIQVIYGDERSKIRPWRDTCRWLAWRRRVLRTRQAHSSEWCSP